MKIIARDLWLAKDAGISLNITDRCYLRKRNDVDFAGAELLGVKLTGETLRKLSPLTQKAESATEVWLEEPAAWPSKSPLKAIPLSPALSAAMASSGSRPISRRAARASDARIASSRLRDCASIASQDRWVASCLSKLDAPKIRSTRRLWPKLKKSALRSSSITLACRSTWPRGWRVSTQRAFQPTNLADRRGAGRQQQNG